MAPDCSLCIPRLVLCVLDSASALVALRWTPWTLPVPSWLFDVEQLWRHEFNQALVIDNQIFQAKMQVRRQLDATSGHNKLTFTSVRGATPTLESVEQSIEQVAVCVPLSQRVRQKEPERFEAFVDLPSSFQEGQLDGAPGWLHQICPNSVVVSCQRRPLNLEEVTLEQRVLTTNPAQIFQHLTQFWQPLWQLDDTHLLTQLWISFLDPLQPSHLLIDSRCLDTWLQVIRSLKWNSAPGPDGITAFELQALPV